MGGIRVNKDGHAYGLKGLFALGEASNWDMHGFNRLGGNSLAETVVAGMVVGKKIAAYTKTAVLNADGSLAEKFAKEQTDKIAHLMNNTGKENVYKIRDEIAHFLREDVHIFRTGEKLDNAVRGLKDILGRLKDIRVTTSAPGMNPELSQALRIEGMAKQAYIIAKGAALRTESRGAHTREDYPARDDKNWLNRTLATWPTGADEPEFNYEPVGMLDLPPGDRGYGGGQMIDMDLTLDEYNSKVYAGQTAFGKHATIEPMGTRLPKELWRKESPYKDEK